MEYLKQILQDMLTMIYQYAGVSVICSLLFIMVWRQAEEYSWKVVGKNLLLQLKESGWKKRFVTVLYIVFVFQRTIFNRPPWGNPLSNIIGEWWVVQDGEFNFEMFENIILFIPLIPLIKITKLDQGMRRLSKLDLISAVVISFLSSLLIEMVQLMMRVGAFQLSDLCYNMVGGIIGWLLYWIVKMLRNAHKNSNSHLEDTRNSDEYNE